MATIDPNSSQAAIFEKLGISQKAVEKRIYGALKKLRKTITEI